MNFKNRFYSYLNSAEKILQLYDGSIPFAHFIKNYFSQHKKFGSKDRKQISNLCYSFFRLGKAVLDIPMKERILLGLQYHAPQLDIEWKEIIDEFSLTKITVENIFPWKDALSETIDHIAFEASFAAQPDLFLRIRAGYEKTVLQKLNAAAIAYSIEDAAIRLPNAAKMDDILQINREVVVQDLSSQKTGMFLEMIKKYFPENHSISVYDCCAASGGKSILAKDILKNITLTVSDIRPSIIANLKKRFQQAGINHYTAFVQDIGKENALNEQQQFDLIIADLPCTGSGTWARTPEQLYYFNPEKIDEYVLRQSQIVQSVEKMLKPDGFLLYITCSVFKKENEMQLNTFLQNGFSLIDKKIIKGYETQADTLFGAILRK
jgi:16S rRNA (cytosine967-C5)-methyltransferase